MSLNFYLLFSWIMSMDNYLQETLVQRASPVPFLFLSSPFLIIIVITIIVIVKSLPFSQVYAFLSPHWSCLTLASLFQSTFTLTWQSPLTSFSFLHFLWPFKRSFSLLLWASSRLLRALSTFSKASLALSATTWFFLVALSPSEQPLGPITFTFLRPRPKPLLPMLFRL